MIWKAVPQGVLTAMRVLSLSELSRNIAFDVEQPFTKDKKTKYVKAAEQPGKKRRKENGAE